MPKMRAAETLRDQRLDGQMEQFFSGALEHLLRLGVGVQNAPPLVDFEGCIRCGLEKQGNSLGGSNAFRRFPLTCGHCGVLPLGALRVAQISQDRQVADSIAHRRAPNSHWYARPVLMHPHRVDTLVLYLRRAVMLAHLARLRLRRNGRKRLALNLFLSPSEDPFGAIAP